MQTIAKNRTAKIFDAITSANSYTLDNGFGGKPIADLERFRAWLGERSSDAKAALDKATGKGRIRFHSNHWIEFEASL